MSHGSPYTFDLPLRFKLTINIITLLGFQRKIVKNIFKWYETSRRQYKENVSQNVQDIEDDQ